jgi:Low-density lipoprotein receptor domain class A
MKLVASHALTRFVCLNLFHLAAFTCKDGYSKCPNLSVCMPTSYFCDGYNHCGDNSDEPDDCRE